MYDYVAGPRYQVIHERLRDLVGYINLQAFRSQFYFIHPTSQEFLHFGRFVNPTVSSNF